jgi:predicted ester cyclase
VQEDRAVAFWTARGIHRGPLWGVPPTGRRVVAATVSLFRFRNGKVAEYEARPDRLGLLLQLGDLGDFATQFVRNS